MMFIYMFIPGMFQDFHLWFFCSGHQMNNVLLFGAPDTCPDVPVHVCSGYMTRYVS